MKKLLSILGSLGMVATAGMAVVACSKNENKASESYKDFESWVKDSKDNNRTDIVFVGGRKDIDSLSFLAAKQAVVKGAASVDPQNIDSLIKQSNIDEVDKDLYSKLKDDSTNADAVSAKSAIENAISPIGQSNNQAKTIIDDFWKNDKVPNYDGNQMGMHTVLVDDVSTFWNNGLGKEIRKGFLNDQVKKWNDFYHDHWKQNNFVENIEQFSKSKDKQTPRQKEVILRMNAISKFLDSSQKGPFFIVLNNGNIAGISSGFNNYKQFNNVGGDEDKYTVLDDSSAIKDISKLFNSFMTNIWAKLDSWIQNCIFPSTAIISGKPEDESSSFLVENKSIHDWHASTGNTYNKDNALPLKDDTKTTFALDLKKYID